MVLEEPFFWIIIQARYKSAEFKRIHAAIYTLRPFKHACAFYGITQPASRRLDTLIGIFMTTSELEW